jgi:hypothetical protein
MPLMRGKDSIGSYYRWGSTGAKYYYTSKNKKQRRLAKRRALKQAVAIAYSKGIEPHDYLSEHNI